MGAPVGGDDQFTEILVRFLHGAQGQHEGFFRVVAGNDLQAEGVILVQLAAQGGDGCSLPDAAFDERMGRGLIEADVDAIVVGELLHKQLNLTRADMRRAGHSPSVRIFEAAACGTPIISDYWRGLEDFFELEKEILTASTTAEMLVYLNEIPEKDRRAMGERARLRVLANHTPQQRALELESYVAEVMKITTLAIA